MTGDVSGVDFANPPVNEVAMGLEFQPLNGLSVGRLVELRNLWAPPYNEQEDHPALPSIPLEGEMPFIQFGSGMPPLALRLWGEDRVTGRLLQIQQDRLILNWRRLTPEMVYPRYDAMRHEFSLRWNQLLTAILSYGMSAPIPAIAEYTYVNSIQATGDTDLTKALETIVSAPGTMPGHDGGVFYRTQRRLRGESGNSGIVVVTAQREPDVAHWNLTITTKVQASSIDPLTWLDIAHAASRDTFVSVTTGAAQSQWGLR